MKETQMNLSVAEQKRIGFVGEMRAVAMRMHTREQSIEGEKRLESPEEEALENWKPTMEGYLKFLVDSMFVHQTVERITEAAPVPYYIELSNTGLERSIKVSKDLEWFKEQGYTIPEPSVPGITYANYLEESAEKDPQAFICGYYNLTFGHFAGGRIVGKDVANKLLDKRELEFYKCDGDVPRLLHNVRLTLNKIADGWTAEERKHCLEVTNVSFKYLRAILRLILT